MVISAWSLDRYRQRASRCPVRAKCDDKRSLIKQLHKYIGNRKQIAVSKERERERGKSVSRWQGDRWSPDGRTARGIHGRHCSETCLIYGVLTISLNSNNWSPCSFASVQRSSSWWSPGEFLGPSPIQSALQSESNPISLNRNAPRSRSIAPEATNRTMTIWKLSNLQLENC